MTVTHESYEQTALRLVNGPGESDPAIVYALLAVVAEIRAVREEIRDLSRSVTQGGVWR